MATQTKNGKGKLIFVDKYVGGKFQKISFKVNRIKSQVGCGVGIISVSENSKYTLNSKFIY